MDSIKFSNKNEIPRNKGLVYTTWLLLLSLVIISFTSALISWKVETEILELELAIELLQKDCQEFQTVTGDLLDSSDFRREKRAADSCVCPPGKT